MIAHSLLFVADLTWPGTLRKTRECLGSDNDHEHSRHHYTHYDREGTTNNAQEEDFSITTCTSPPHPALARSISSLWRFDMNTSLSLKLCSI